MIPKRDKNGRFIKKVTNTRITHYALVLDSSGSMSGYEDQAIGAFNKQLETLKQLERNGEKITVTMVLFGVNGFPNAIETRAVGVKASEVVLLDRSNYHPAGGTPLFEAMNVATNALRSLPALNANYVVFTVTDGFENQSARGAMDVTKYNVEQGIKNDLWTYAMMVPRGGMKNRLMEQIGVLDGNVAEWDITVQGTVDMGIHGSGSTMSAHTTRSSNNLTSSNSAGYFSPNLAKLTTTKIKKELTDLSKECKAWTVEKETSIKDFVEGKNITFYLGAGYYQLMKTEKVQASKQILLVEKGKKAIYGGAEARELLGLPNTDVKVVPGNHSKYDIYIQSTSHNRILPRGTKLIYRLDHTVNSSHTWAKPGATSQP